MLNRNCWVSVDGYEQEIFGARASADENMAWAFAAYDPFCNDVGSAYEGSDNETPWGESHSAF